MEVHEMNKSKFLLIHQALNLLCRFSIFRGRIIKTKSAFSTRALSSRPDFLAAEETGIRKTHEIIHHGSVSQEEVTTTV